MKTIQINIGLKTNAGEDLNYLETLETVITKIQDHYKLDTIESRVTQSTTEPTMVLKFSLDGSTKLIQLIRIIRALANQLDQDCIAIKSDNNGLLIYSKNPKNDWGLFNEEYFINY